MCIAVGHWIVASIEDTFCWELLAGNIEGTSAMYLLAFVYASHHSVTIFAYIYILVSEDLASLGVLGMIFEIPVAVQSIREYAVMFGHSYETDENAPWIVKLWIERRGCASKRDDASVEETRRYLKAYWVIFLTTIVVCRFGPCTLYVVSLIMWTGELRRQLSTASLVVYYVLGAVFCVANPTYMYLQTTYMSIDFASLDDETDGEVVPKKIDLSEVCPSSKVDAGDGAGDSDSSTTSVTSVAIDIDRETGSQEDRGDLYFHAPMGSL